MINSKNIREQLERDYPKIQWEVRKKYKQPMMMIRGSLFRNRKTHHYVEPKDLFEPGTEELHALQMISFQSLGAAQFDMVDSVGKAFYNDMKDKVVQHD